MQVLDLIFTVLIGLLVLRGFLKGFTGELFSLASVALSLIAAALFFRNGAVFIRSRYMQTAFFPEILAFLIIFVAVFAAGKIVEHIVKDIITRTNLGTLDKILGIIIGLAEGFAVTVILLFILTVQPLFDSAEFLDQSIFARLLLPLVGVFHV